MVVCGRKDKACCCFVGGSASGRSEAFRVMALRMAVGRRRKTKELEDFGAASSGRAPGHAARSPASARKQRLKSNGHSPRRRKSNGHPKAVSLHPYCNKNVTFWSLPPTLAKTRRRRGLSHRVPRLAGYTPLARFAHFSKRPEGQEP